MHMSISKEDLAFIQEVDKQLQETGSLSRVVMHKENGEIMPYETLYSRLVTAGYEIETSRRLVPKKPAPDLDSAA